MHWENSWEWKPTRPVLKHPTEKWLWVIQLTAKSQIIVFTLFMTKSEKHDLPSYFRSKNPFWCVFNCWNLKAFQAACESTFYILLELSFQILYKVSFLSILVVGGKSKNVFFFLLFFNWSVHQRKIRIIIVIVKIAKAVSGHMRWYPFDSWVIVCGFHDNRVRPPIKPTSAVISSPKSFVIALICILQLSVLAHSENNQPSLKTRDRIIIISVDLYKTLLTSRCVTSALCCQAGFIPYFCKIYIRVADGDEWCRSTISTASSSAGLSIIFSPDI